MNQGLEGPRPAKCGSSAPRSHRHKAVLSPVTLTLKLSGVRPLPVRVERIVNSWVRYFIYSDEPHFFVCTGGQWHVHIDQSNDTDLFP